MGCAALVAAGPVDNGVGCLAKKKKSDPAIATRAIAVKPAS
jgi:hypothetical protein